MKAIIDCNSFYCGCERLFRPDLWQKPVVVLSNNDGCIISRTDEAKTMGVNMAVPYYQSKDAIRQHGISVFSSNYYLYGDLSRRVMDSLKMLVGADKIEVYSVDECFVDLDEVPVQQLSAYLALLKEKVEMWTGIKVSIGAAPTKVLSKVANKLAKKDKQGTGGIYILDTPDIIQKALKATQVAELWGIGSRYAYKLREEWHIYNAWQLRQMSESWARKQLGGVTGVRFIRELQEDPCIALKDPLIKKKMIATTRMFGKPVYALKDLREAIATYTTRAAEKLRRQHAAAGLVEVMLVFNDESRTKEYAPRSVHRHILLPTATSITHELLDFTLPMVEQLYQPGLRYIKGGVMLADIVPDTAIQGNLFFSHTYNRRHLLMEAIDNINFGIKEDTVKYVSSGLERNWKMRQEMRSPRYTTRWNELCELH